MLFIFHKLFFIAVAAIGFNFVVSFHEFGHLLFAKIFGIGAPSFSIGFGPKLFSKKIGGTEFSLSAIPLGGYVEIEGHEEVGQGDQKSAKSKGKNSFNSRPYWQKFLVMFGGIMCNLLFAYFGIILLYAIGMPQTPSLFPNQVKTVIASTAPGSLAEKYDLTAGDQIILANGKKVENFKEYSEAVSNSDMIELEVKTTAGSITKIQGKMPLGVSFKVDSMQPEGLVQSITNGISTTNQAIKFLATSIINIFKFKKFGNLGGPIAIFSQTMATAKQGFKPFLIFLIFLSIQLALLNLLPIPILDGGQILFVTIEAIAGRNLPEKVKLGIHYACWIFMLIMIALISLQDIYKLFFN